MSEVRKHGNPSGLPIRKVRKGQVDPMAPTTRIQTGCSAKPENAFSRGQVGLFRNRLGGKPNKPTASVLRQSQISAKPLLNLCRREVEASKSTPDLTRFTRTSRPTITSVLSVADNLQKVRSWENMSKPSRKTSSDIIGTQCQSRIPMKSAASVIAVKSKPPTDFLKRPKKPVVECKSVAKSKSIENKRKLSCAENVSEMTKHKVTESKVRRSPITDTSLECPLSANNRTEECKKIVKKIMLEKKANSAEGGGRKRCSAEFEDSVGTFNSDELADLLSTDNQSKTVESVKTQCDSDKLSKRNSSEFDDSIGSFFSDQMVLTMSKSNEFLNLTGSKQSFFNENPLGLSVSENMDNLTPGLSNLSNSIDRTPSAEDLPMECEAEPETVLPEPETTACDRSTSPTEQQEQESLSSRTLNAPVSIITSVTSIVSLDTGYQGDGELSRPESRNTENDSRLLKLSIAENGIPVKGINFDDGKTMTDSDFFTESDADIHDDLSAAAAEIGSGKGDRKAQVIDGTLYGGTYIQSHVGNSHGGHDHNTAALNNQSARLITSKNNEDMESSGIYSDLERKPEESCLGEKFPSIFSTDVITKQIKTIQNLVVAASQIKLKPVTPSEGLAKSSSGESASTIRENVSLVESCDVIDADRGNISSDVKNQPSKNVVKTPGRTGPPLKSKSTLASEAPVKDSRVKTVKKGKWDDVMDKIAQRKEENKYTPSKFRDVKSKVFQNMGTILAHSRRNEAESKVPPGSQLKSRSRRSTRIRSSESSLVSPKSKQSRTTASPNSSQRSSLSDISLSVNPHQKSASRGSKKRDSLSPRSNESTNSANTPIRKLNNNDATPSKGNKATIPCRNSDLQNGNVTRSPSGTVLDTMKTPTLRRAPTPRRDPGGPTLQRTASVPFKDSNHNGIVSKSGSAVIISNNNNNNSINQNNNNSSSNNVKSSQGKSLKPASRVSNPVHMKNGCLLAAAKEANKALIKQLKHNGRAFESLAILFSYCANDLDAFSTPHLKQKLESEKSKVVQAQSDIEDLQSRLIRAQEELNDKDLVIADLNNVNTSLGERGEHFRKLVEELQNKLDVVTEQKCEAESEFMKECENVRCLRRELSNRTDKHEIEKEDLTCSLAEAKRENGVLKSANREIKEEYDKCLLENQRLVELVSKRQNEMVRVGKENWEAEEVPRTKQKMNGSVHEESPERLPSTPLSREKSFWNGTPMSAQSINPKCLESEVESLRQVLALKTDEVTELRRQQLSLRENADRVPKLLSTIAMLEGKVEDLQSQISSQTEAVRDLYKSNEHLETELKSANNQKTRLMQKNEELQYKLKQYAEAMKQLASQKNFSEKSIKTEFSPIKSNSRQSTSCADDLVKSQMKAVVEKSDSVSYMLEMTEDSTEIVTNIIRRAESLRSTNRDQITSKKRRPKAWSTSSTDTPVTRRTFSIEDDFSPNRSYSPSTCACDYDNDGRVSSASSDYSARGAVKLNQADFSTDSIEVPTENDCEIIEITKNFDRSECGAPEKNGVMTASTSSSGSSSSNESHFDIESDVFAQLEEGEGAVEGVTASDTGHRHSMDGFEEEEEEEEEEDDDDVRPVLPVYQDLESPKAEKKSLVKGARGNGAPSKNCLKIPKISGGESMVGLSSDEDDAGKNKRIYKQ